MFNWNFDKLSETERNNLQEEYNSRVEDIAKNGNGMCAQYKNDPEAFRQRRAAFNDICARQNSADIAGWKLVDTYQDKLYAAFDAQELEAFVKHQRSHEYIRCILMDRVMQSEGVDSADMMWPDSIHLVKGNCVFYPRNPHVDFCIDDLPIYVNWSIDQSHAQNKATDELKKACKELVDAGVTNKLIAECANA